MNLSIRAGVLAAVLLVGTAMSAVTKAAELSVEATAMAFLDAYAAGNWAAVEAAVSKRGFQLYGSDIAEFCDDESGLKRQFTDDQKLWRGGAHFGAATQMTSVRTGNLATLFFNREFELGDQKVVVRFSTVWRRESGAWKLVQSSNAVPTKGQSASEILAPKAG